MDKEILQFRKIAQESDDSKNDGIKLTSKEVARAEEVREAYKSLQSAVKQFIYAFFRITLSNEQMIELTNKLRTVILGYITDISDERLQNILGDLVAVPQKEKSK